MNASRSAIQFFFFSILIIALAGVGSASTDPPAAAAPVADSGQPAAASDAAPAQQQSSGAPTGDQRIQQLQQKVDELDQKLKDVQHEQELKKVEDAAEAEKNKTKANVYADTTGFTIASPHGNFVLKIGADLQVDNRTYFGVNTANPMDAMILRRVRPTIYGTVYKYVDYYFRPDFGQGTTVIYDAYVELKYFSFAKIRAGKFKPGIGLERLQSDDDTTFVERGLPTLLVPSRDIGYQIGGDIVPNHINYSVGVFNGVPDNSLSDASVSDHRDFAARLFFNPLNPEVANLGFGIGASSGNTDGEALPSYKTFGQNSFTTFNSGVTEAGHRTRLAPGMYYYMGGFGLFSEYGLTEEDMQKGLTRADVGFRAWQVAGSYMLTGEKKSFGSPTPRRPFDPKNHAWGAVELAVRTGEFTADKALFSDGFATSTVTPRLAHEVVVGANWYLNRLFRYSLDYGRTNFGGGATVAQGINKSTEKVLIMRFQINFADPSMADIM